MQTLDYRVIEQAVEWLEQGHTIWLCTVLSTFGSSPREPGALMVARANGDHLGSLSGGCVEEDFLQRLVAGAFPQPAVTIRYGGSDGTDAPGATVRLPCGGVLEVLVERHEPGSGCLEQLRTILGGLGKGVAFCREVSLANGEVRLSSAGTGYGQGRAKQEGEQVLVTIAPVARLILAGHSPVAEACARFAVTLGYEVVICDPRKEITDNLALPDGVTLVTKLPSVYLETAGVCTPTTAVVASTHDPRIDDLAMMAAVKTPAGYIGVMGSMRTSRSRAERLRRSGGLTEAEIERIHMPIGLDIGSKTPAEIALSIMADVVRTRRGKPSGS
ncbi:XdhC family protein [Marinobacter daepoensis]|uniref:XdhC family protein n=1 Tax=Marinobacter daepoensis TaxID=262077 RepID=A0ABS3BDX8_9GAMM|nr:XdhC family protein [Marinobacter daepoensis]MBN7769101.1 XdhC family protein [Marinobacter daepoensis]MBY6077791.1 XdhC family protein [Marinobacter daepoensis]